MKSLNTVIKYQDVESKVIELRGQMVLIDRDVAELYGVKTKEVNQAIKNNQHKFPYGYLFEIDKYEKTELVKNFDRFNILKHSNVNPTAFTERGLYMLATILKSPLAAEVTIAIIETFTSIREMTRKMEELQVAETQTEQKTLLKQSGELMADIIGRNLNTTSTETEIELNLALVKIKHKVIKEKEKPQK
jgi:prophage antirepressor-like protein